MTRAVALDYEDESTDVRSLTEQFTAALKNHRAKVDRFKERAVSASQPASSASYRPVALLVDDDELVLRALGRELERRGLDVVPARTAVEARRQLEFRPFDLVVLDLRLDGDQLGSKLCERVRVRSLSPMCPVVLLTGVLDADTARRLAVRCGANAVAMKDEGVTEAADMLVEYARRYRELE